MLNPLIKKLAGFYSNKCPTCKKIYIESLINSYKKNSSCPDCRKQIFFGKIILKSMMFYTKMDNNDLIDLSSDPEAMPLINALARGLGKHGLKIMKTGIPLYVVFDVTNKCNLKCIHCYSSKYDKELTKNDLFHIIDMLYRNGAGIIDFGGGEPLLRDDIFEILSYSKKIGLYTSISTNGTLLDKDCVKRLKSINIDHVCISLDGANSETHDHIRNKKGTFEKAIIGIKNCLNAGINTQISTVIMKNNIDELDEIHKLLTSLKVDGWYVYDFIPAGRGEKLQYEVIDSKKRQQLLNRLQQLAISGNMLIKPYPYSITVNSASEKDSYFYKKYGKLTEMFKGCLTARWMCHISSNGDLHPCHLLPQKLGNLKQENFDEIWFDKNNLLLNELRNRSLLKGKCGTCNYRDFCGGCRARAFWKTNDYLESDTCWISVKDDK